MVSVFIISIKVNVTKQEIEVTVTIPPPPLTSIFAPGSCDNTTFVACWVAPSGAARLGGR